MNNNRIFNNINWIIKFTNDKNRKKVKILI